MIADDAVTRWSQRKLLETLSKNSRQPVLAEMAREMLAGRLTTRQAMASDAYMQALGSAAGPGLARLRDMPPEALAATEREARLEAERLMVAEERDAASARRRGPVEEEPTGSIMVGAPGRPRRPEPVEDASAGSFTGRPRRTDPTDDTSSFTGRPVTAARHAVENEPAGSFTAGAPTRPQHPNPTEDASSFTGRPVTAARARRTDLVEDESAGSFMVGAAGRQPVPEDDVVVGEAGSTLPRSMRDRAGRRRG